MKPGPGCSANRETGSNRHADLTNRLQAASLCCDLLALPLVLPWISSPQKPHLNSPSPSLNRLVSWKIDLEAEKKKKQKKSKHPCAV
jgi:hypothetical protein